MTTQTDHKCLFPCNPPGGSFFAPGPCGTCGKTYARSQAEQILAEARAAMKATEPETAEPAALAAIFARYREIAPEPSPDSPDVARELTRRLLVSAIRRDNRLEAGILGGGAVSAEDHAGLTAEFAAAHLLQEMRNNAPAVADEAAAVIAGAALDGSAGEWVRQHAQSLGIDTAEVDRLATAEARLRSAQPS